MNAEPQVIKVRTFGATERVTLREYVDLYVQDWEAGLNAASDVAENFPSYVVYNEGDFFSDPEYVQLHTAIDADLLRSEINRLQKEEE